MYELSLLRKAKATDAYQLPVLRILMHWEYEVGTGKIRRYFRTDEGA